MRHLIYFDSFSYGHFHEDFNASSLLMLSKIFDSIDYYVTDSSYNSVISILKGMPDNVIRHKLCEIEDGGSLRNGLRHLWAFILNSICVITAPKDYVVFINYNCIWGLNIIARLAELRKVYLIQVCHGELEGMVNKAISVNRLTRRGLDRIQSGYYSQFKYFFLCVLGESILSNLRSVLDAGTISRILTFEHTFVHEDRETSSIPEIKTDKRIKLAVVGVPDKNKGIDDFIRLSENLDHRKFRFFVLGRIGVYSRIFDAHGIEYIKGYRNGFVPRTLLRCYMDEMSLILFFYPNDSYKYTASGALLTVLDSRKPVLSYHNSYFDHILPQTNSGVLFNSYEEMYDFLNDIDEDSLDRLYGQSSSQILEPESEAVKFSALLKEHRIIV